MKKIISLCLVLIFVFVLNTTPAFADSSNELRFLDLQWFSGVDEVKAAIADRITKDQPTGEFEVGSWTFLSYQTYKNPAADGEVKDVPIYELTYEGRKYYQVAGYNVKRMDIQFVPAAADGTYSDQDFSDYQFILARYLFDNDAVNSQTEIYDGLIKKLTALYGEPVDTFAYNSNGSFTYKIKGVVWQGANHTSIKLHYSYSYNAYTGTMDGTVLTYGYADKDYFDAKTGLTLNDSGTSNLDVGDTNGL